MAERFLAILCVKDEGPFLAEWVAWHRSAGFTDILVFSNDCSDGTGAILDRMAALGLVTHVANPGGPKGPQWSALAAAARHPAYAAADWAMVIDIDEFVVLRDGTLRGLVAACPGADAIALTWRLYGNAGIASRNRRGMLETFTRAAPTVLHWPWKAQMVKTLFRPAAFARPGVHRPRPRDGHRPVTVDGAGRPLAHDRLFTALGADCTAHAHVAHFALGAMDDFIVKAARGRSNREASAPDAGYWIERNFSAVAAPLPPPDPPADAEVARLTARAEDWRAGRFAALMQDPAWRQLYGQCRLAGPARLLSPAEARTIWARGAQDAAPAGRNTAP